MSYILNIETSTTVCSVSLSKNAELIAWRELDEGFTHAENLHVFIGDLMRESGLSMKEISAVATSKGPGSYTGLRIGVSAAKGFAYALKLPLIGIDTLQLMCNHPDVLKHNNAVFCPMIDARRMEVYMALYNENLENVSPVEAFIVDEKSIQKFKNYAEVVFFGNGMPKCSEVLRTLPNSSFIDHIVPSARNMCSLSFKKFSNRIFEDVAYFEPFYLKDFLVLKK